MTKIKENEWFEITVDGELYRAIITWDCDNPGKTAGDITFYFNMVVKKLKPVKFLWFNFNVSSWIYDYPLFSERLIEDSGMYEIIDDERVYSIDTVTSWLKEAIHYRKYEI